MRTRSKTESTLHTVTQYILVSGALNSAAQAILSRHTTTSNAHDDKSVAADAARWLLSAIVVMLCTFAGAALILSAAYLMLREQMEADAALAALGTALWLMAGALLLYGRRIKAEPEPRRNASEEVLDEIKKLSVTHPFLLIAAAFGVGLALSKLEGQAGPPPGTTS